MYALEIKAFAKINIGLKIFQRRISGYHDIESIFQNVSLSDTIWISTGKKNNKERVTIEGDFGCPINLSSVYRAAIEFDKASDGIISQNGVYIQVKKGIPAQAGLGAASADAAATLCGLNELFSMQFSKKELTSISIRIGSDVPFFLYGGAAIVRGRGELINLIDPRTDFGIVILLPSWSSSTQDAYSLLDVLRCNDISWIPPATEFRESESVHCVCSSDEKLKQWYHGPIVNWHLENDFQPVMEKQHREYKEWSQFLMKNGAICTSLTGSGSAMYGVFKSMKEADTAAEECRTLLKGAEKSGLCTIACIFSVTPLARSMIVSYIQACNVDTRSDKERSCHGSD